MSGKTLPAYDESIVKVIPAGACSIKTFMQYAVPIVLRELRAKLASPYARPVDLMAALMPSAMIPRSEAFQRSALVRWYLKTDAGKNHPALAPFNPTKREAPPHKHRRSWPSKLSSHEGVRRRQSGERKPTTDVPVASRSS